MKKLVLFFIICASVVPTINAQTNPFFAPNNSVWVQEHYYWMNPPPQHVKSYAQFLLKNDTIINNKNYSKLFDSYYSIFDTILNCYNFWNFLYCDSNKVYFGINPDSMTILYDFNLVKGDTFAFTDWYSLNHLAKCAVDSVGSVIIGSENRKKIWFTRIKSGIPPIVWVEGIGDIEFGLITDYSGIDIAYGTGNGTFQLDCFTDNLNSTIGSCAYGSCNIAINEENSENKFLFYPNPSSNNLTIETPPQSIIKISNIEGQLIRTLANSGAKTNIDVSTLPCGVYIVEVKTEKGIAVKKFIKE